jgi:uncharacterized FAD-dependent dehydrogenase
MPGYKRISIEMPPDFSQDELREEIAKKSSVKEFTYNIAKQSLDARKKKNIHILLHCDVFSDELTDDLPKAEAPLEVKYKKRNKKVIVVGSGPAGFYSAYLLQLSGFDTVIIERGDNVETRSEKICKFNTTGEFNSKSNYAFGEGGAGTFSDGKLTARSKRISKEKKYILKTYIEAGAPSDIEYLANPHLGSDKLQVIVKNLREKFLSNGGTILFDTQMTGFKAEKGKVTSVQTNKDELYADYLLVASGLSAYDTYRMMISNGVQFRTKNFAMGFRVEHPQSLINQAQWGRESVPGLKAAEYRLTYKEEGVLPVYSFCMCPGGVVVPSTPYANCNIVNGMSMYDRSGKFANAGIVAAIHPDMLLGDTATALETLSCVEMHEQNFHEIADGYAAPFCTIRDFIKKRSSGTMPETSHPLGLVPAPLYNIMPSVITSSIRKGLRNFSNKINGFREGIILGLESKTSSPIQALRDKSGLCEGFDNLFFIGEGSGYAGGIISSAVDGIRAATAIAE